MNKLKIVEVDSGQQKSAPGSILKQHAMQARMELLWKNDPGQFDPMRNVREQQRLDKTKAMLQKHLDLQGLRVLDLGAGSGKLTVWLQEAGAHTMAVDTASLALAHIPDAIEKRRETLPVTSLPDAYFDLVILADVIASIPSPYHRLCIFELSRVMKKEGRLLLSTALDIDSENPIIPFNALLRTEFEILEQTLSYHRLHLRASRWFKGINKSKKWLKKLEYLTELLWGEEGASHVIAFAKKKKLA